MKALIAHHPTRSARAKHPSRLRALLTRKIWLPKLIYEGLPVFYAVLGMLAIGSTLFVTSWYWVVPFYWLLGLMCLHGAGLIWGVRKRYRRRHKQEHDA